MAKVCHAGCEVTVLLLSLPPRKRPLVTEGTGPPCGNGIESNLHLARPGIEPMSIKAVIDKTNLRQRKIAIRIAFLACSTMLVFFILVYPILNYDPIMTQENAANQAAIQMKGDLRIYEDNISKQDILLTTLKRQGKIIEVEIALLVYAGVLVRAAVETQNKAIPLNAALVIERPENSTIWAVPEQPKLVIRWNILIFGIGSLIAAILVSIALILNTGAETPAENLVSKPSSKRLSKIDSTAAIGFLMENVEDARKVSEDLNFRSTMLLRADSGHV